MFPSGNLLLTASVRARRGWLPDEGMEFVQFHDDVIPSNIEVIPRLKYTEEELIQLESDFNILRMVFPVRY